MYLFVGFFFILIIIGICLYMYNCICKIFSVYFFKVNLFVIIKNNFLDFIL